MSFRPFPRQLALLVVLGLVASACISTDDEADRPIESDTQAPAEEADTTDDDVAPEGPTGDGDDDEEGGADRSQPFQPSITDDEVAERLSQLEGRLAVGNGPQVAVSRPDGAGYEVLDGSESIVAAQPTWSHDGQHLAWSSVSARQQAVVVQSFDDEGRMVDDPATSDAAGNPIFYLQWNEADDRLAYIRNAPSGSVVEVGVLEPGLPVEPVGQGAPFFISWSPAPHRILGHVNEVSIDSFDASDVPGPGFRSVLPVAGGFSAPVWVDDERALIVSEGALSYLDVASGETEAIVNIDGPIRFTLSPDKTKVAYQQVGGAAEVEVIGLQPVQNRSSLVVLDLESGREVGVTESPAVAWDWSPDSDKLAWLGAELSARGPLGQWRFWSATGQVATVESAGFGLTRKVGRAYLPFFAQYAQSITGWSPDSTAYAFAGAIDGERGIWVQLVDEVVGPRRVAPGDFVTWGVGQAPPAGGQPSAA